MLIKTVLIDGGADQLERARQALDALSGVVAADLVPGEGVRVHQGDGLSDGALLGALSGLGLRGARVVHTPSWLK